MCIEVDLVGILAPKSVLRYLGRTQDKRRQIGENFRSDTLVEQHDKRRQMDAIAAGYSNPERRFGDDLGTFWEPKWPSSWSVTKNVTELVVGN